MELPFNLVAGTTAKAAQVMANLNAVKNAIDTIETVIAAGKIVAGAVGNSQLVAGAVTKTKLATGYTRKHAGGIAPAEIGAGYAFSLPVYIAHGLGEAPSSFTANVYSVENWVIAMDVRVISLDATYAKVQVIASSNMPGNFPCGIYWHALGQP